ncbi:MAG: type II secretion system F family protein [Planctomycetia bacterium]|nr:type II secretion system F family protein [Planctomycetia bacterium]
MTRFRFQATDANGQPLDGELSAESADAARGELTARGLKVLEVRVIDDSTGHVIPPEQQIPLGRIKGADAAMLAGQLANVVQTGLPLSAGLRALSEEVPSSSVKYWLLAVSDRLDQGHSLSDIAREADGSWPRFFIAILDAGQRTGRLSELLSECVVHLRTSADIRRQMRVALAYPVLLGVATWSVLSFLATWVVPQMRDIFIGFGTELPGLTVFVLNVSYVMESFGWWFMPIAVIAMWIAWYACDPLGLSQIRDRFASSLPLFGEARRSAALGDFCRLLSLLTQHRVPLSDAIRLAASGVRDTDLRATCLDLAMRVDSGQSLSEAAIGTGRFPNDLLHLFHWADRDGDFADGLQTASEMLSAQSRVHSHSLAVVCEPAVAVLLGGVVGITVIALFMPMIKLLNDLS